MSKRHDDFDPNARDHNCLHCQLALPIQHFIDKHPDVTREELIRQAAEMIAELIGSATPEWTDARRLLRYAVQELHDQVPRKFSAFEEMRRRA